MIGDNLIYYAAYKPISNHIASLLRSEKIPSRKAVIAISGESGCGKSSLAHSLLIDLETLSDYKGYIFHMDDYFKLPPLDNHKARLQDISQVGPDEVKLDQLDDHLKSFKDGSSLIKKPLMNYLENQMSIENLDSEELDFCIVEGTYTCLLNHLDYRIFMEMNYSQTKQQRMERGRDIMDDFNEKVLEIEHQIIKKQAEVADMVVTSDLKILTNTY